MLTELVDYEYYMNNYEDCSIPKSSFKKHNIDASTRVNNYTFGRITKEILEQNDSIKTTVCEIIELLYDQEQLIAKLADDRVKASETVGPHAVTYVNKTNLQAQRILDSKELEKECYRICYKHLARTGLMYRGVY